LVSAVGYATIHLRYEGGENKQKKSRPWRGFESLMGSLIAVAKDRRGEKMHAVRAMP